MIARGMLRGVAGAVRLGPDVWIVGGVVVPRDAPAVPELRPVDITSPTAYVLNGHSAGSLSYVAAGDYTDTTWTGSGGNANDTLPEQLHTMHPIEDASGVVIDLANRTHAAHWRLATNPATWSGASSVIVGAGVVHTDSGGVLQSTPHYMGILGSGRAANLSYYAGQNATGSGVVRIDGWWIPNPDPSSPTYGALIQQAFDASGAPVRSEAVSISGTVSAGDVLSLALGLGNDYSLTSGATYTEPIALWAIAYPVG